MRNCEGIRDEETVGRDSRTLPVPILNEPPCLPPPLPLGRLAPAGTVSPSDVAAIIELTATQLEVLQEVLAALSVANASRPQGSSPLGQEQIYLHELSLFMFCQLFSKEAQRPDSMECWPGEASSTGTELMSPTRGHAKSPNAGAFLIECGP